MAAVLLLCTPAAARANGDPASDYLLVQGVFLPFSAKIDADASKRLQETIRAADDSNFKIKVAVISTRYLLGTAYSLFGQPQKYAQFLGLELSFQYRGRLLVVMPNGFGVSIKGKPDPAGIRVAGTLPPPGTNVTKQIEAATKAVRRLAAASGVELRVGSASGGGSKTRDRIVIAAGAVALAAVLAAFVFWRRERTSARA